jgi:hypothetical protein
MRAFPRVIRREWVAAGLCLRSTSLREGLLSEELHVGERAGYRFYCPGSRPLIEFTAVQQAHGMHLQRALFHPTDPGRPLRGRIWIRIFQGVFIRSPRPDRLASVRLRSSVQIYIISMVCTLPFRVHVVILKYR